MAREALLLAEIEDLIRTQPTPHEFERGDPDTVEWAGRAFAEGVVATQAAIHATSQSMVHTHLGVTSLVRLLNKARADLRFEFGTTDVVVQTGMVFQYFDELRRVIELASVEVFFVDPYLDADFVGRYLPHVRKGVAIRLLAREKMSVLLPAVDAFVVQEKVSVKVRSGAKFHDRYLFIDKRSCYQSGASFKDGAKNAPTTLTQITDAFQGVWDTYDAIWNMAETER
jgi:hypothetical protein